MKQKEKSSFSLTKVTRSLEGSKLKRTYRWQGPYSFAHNEDYRPFYLLRSNVRLSTFFAMKRMESFFFGLDDDDQVALLSNQLFLDPFSWQVLRAKESLVPYPESPHDPGLVKLLERVTTLQTALGQPNWSLNLLYTLQGVVKYEIVLDQERIRTVKYKGKRIRTPSAVGSKRFGTSSLKIEELQSEIEHSSYLKERDLLPFLTSPIEDYNLLFGEIHQKSIIYQTLAKLIKSRTEVPNYLKSLILYDREIISRFDSV